MMPRKESMDLLGTTLLIAFSALLGVNQALVKIVNDGFAPIFQSGLRSLCALAPVLIFALIMRRKLSVTDGSLPWGLLNGILFTLEFGLLFIALDYTTVARACLFFYVMPVWVSLGAHWLVPGEPLNRNKVIGLSLAILGVAVALNTDLGTAPKNAWVGDFLALIAGVFWAGIALLTRLKLDKVSSEMNLLYQLVVSAIVLLLVAFVSGDTIREPTATIYAIFTFQVLIVVATGFIMWFWILSIYPVSNMASFGLLAPIFGVAFGWYLFDDPLTVGFVIALSLACGGIFIVNKPT
jgi:drug/metabolite transporter (DMT)-like permease